MNKKLLFIMAVGASVLFGGKVQAAVDDAGMKYISAAEGLSGSIRIRMLEDSNLLSGDEDLAVGFDDSRIVYRGDSEMGNGMAVTYLFEFRPGDHSSPNDEEQRFRIEYIDVGLRGKFGHFRIGAIESVSSAIVPSPDRTNDVGDDGEKLADDYRYGGWRWISPDIRGLVLGLSAEVRDQPRLTKDDGDSNVDQYDVAVAYSLPAGLGIGASYSVKSSLVENLEEEKGFRLGAVYERDNWGLGYNFHNYNSAAPKSFQQGLGIDPNDSTAPGLKTNNDLRGHEDTEYVEHVVGANVSLGKFSFAVSYSQANVKNPTLDSTAPEIDSDVKGVDVDFKTTAVDIAYNLGSRAKLIAAYKVEKTSGENLQLGNLTVGDVSTGVKQYYLLARIDF